MLCYLTLLVAAAYSLCSITRLPDSLTWVEEPKDFLMPEKEKEEKKINRKHNVLVSKFQFKGSWISFLWSVGACTIVQETKRRKS